MTLAAQDTKDQMTKRAEARAGEIWEAYNPSMMYVAPTLATALWVGAEPFGESDIVYSAAIESREAVGEVLALVQTKCRLITYKTLVERWRKEWLVSSVRLAQCAEIAKTMSVPVYGFLYLVGEDMLVQKLLHTRSGEQKWEGRAAEGGEAFDTLIKVDHCKLLQGDPATAPPMKDVAWGLIK